VRIRYVRLDSAQKAAKNKSYHIEFAQ
ncbi:uncharacterized protein METZ01_LOCUS29667, partial [marine metagenome]